MYLQFTLLLCSYCVLSFHHGWEMRSWHICRRVREKAPNKHLEHFLINSNYNHVSFFFFLKWVGEVVERGRLWVQTTSVLLNNINNSSGPGDDVFILDFQAPQSTHSKRWQKNESECVGIKHLNSLLPGHYTDCHILHLPSPTMLLLIWLHLHWLIMHWSLFYWTEYSIVTKQNLHIGWSIFLI